MATLDGPNWELLSLDELGILTEPQEDADSFVGNARLKARFAHEQTGLAALADDSGIVVAALAGAPGIYSARFAGPDANDKANNDKLLAALEQVPLENRTAHFACTMVLIDESGQETVAEGLCAGRIALAAQGEAGFGYDPLFLLAAYQYRCTLAELQAAEKNSCSHRYQALRQLCQALSGSGGGSGSDSGSGSGSDAGSDSPAASDCTEPPLITPVVAFDFDGTIINNHSPVRLIARLSKDRIMPRWSVFLSMVWGLWYKMGIERDQSKPRRYIFASFKDSHVSDADAIMRNLYHEELRNYLRPAALATIKKHQQQGRRLVIVSASFTPIIEELCRELEIEDFICTRMEIVAGSYTGETIGKPPESTHKLTQFTQWANQRFGQGNWVLTHAYGDHYSDIPLIETALYPVAVDPDRKLEQIARERGWEIQAWL